MASQACLRVNYNTSNIQTDIQSHFTNGDRVNGIGLGTSQGEGSSSVGNLPEDRGTSLGSGQAVRGQPESGNPWTSTSLLDNERRSTAPVGDTNRAPRDDSGMMQSASSPRENQNGEGSRSPEQPAQGPQPVGGTQSVVPGSRQNAEPNLEGGQQATPNR
jgi:hypothetical protein